MSSFRHNIFVYGSLKRGFSNHSLLIGQRFVAAARTQPSFKLYALGDFPGMVEASEGGRSIEGEIWAVDSACLARLDLLEDTAHGLYARAPIPLLPPNDRLLVEGYLYRLDVTGRRDCGDVWME
jgi:gamma-glutamylaminecyclotransferase